MRRLAGIAGLAYTAGAAVENMELLDAPVFTSPAGDVRAAYDDRAVAVVTSLGGAASLVAYTVFVVALVAALRGSHARGWVAPALAGGLGGVVLAAAGWIATSVLAFGGAADRSDDEVTDLADLALSLRLSSGVLLALFLAAVGVAIARSARDVLPPAFGQVALAIAPLLVVASVAPLLRDTPWVVVAQSAFGMQAVWVVAVSVWLVLAPSSTWPVTFIRRAAFLVLVLAAGLVGLAMVIVPGATGEFFSWALGPEALAAFAGGVYVGSAVTYAVALPRADGEVRGLLAGAVVLSSSVLVITLTHTEPFDFDRLQAWVWLVLFAGFAVVTTALTVAIRSAPPSEPVPPPVRALLAVVALLLGALALALWIDPTGLSGPSPIDLSAIGGRFAGSWVALLTVLCGWAAVRDDAAEARLSAVALVALPAGAMVGAVRTAGDLDAAPAYLAVLGALCVAGLVVLRRGGAPPRPGPPAISGQGQ